MRLKYDPYMLIIDQTIKCNEKCFFCWRADGKKVAEMTKKSQKSVPGKFMQLDLPWDKFTQIIDACAQVDTMTTFNACGPMGDASLVPDMAERGEYAKDKGFSHRMLNTNAAALDRHNPVALMRGFNDIKVSLDTLKPEVYKKIHGRDHHARVMENVYMYWEDKQKHKVPGLFQVKVTLNELNADEEPAITKWSNETGIPITWKRIHSFMDVMPEFGDTAGAAGCEQPYNIINFNMLGQLTTCCINYELDPTFGTLDDDSLKNLWTSTKFETWRENRMEGICKPCTGLGSRKDI